MAWDETDFTLTCDQSGTEHRITVSLPFRYERLDSAPLVVCLDGAWIHGAARDASRVMSMGGDAPEAIVVGVEFTSTSMGEYLRERTRWYTPTPWVPPERIGVKGLTAEECGKADVMRAFLRDQLLPRLAGDYRIDETWVVGHSFSALCALSALLAEPNLFDKWLLASPSVWWDDRAILGIEAAHAEANDDLPTTVFMSAGSHEDADDDESLHMRSNVEELVATLRGRNHPGLRLETAILDGENHNSVIGAAISRGMRALVTAPSSGS